MPPVRATRRAFPQSLFPRDIRLTEPYFNIYVIRVLIVYNLNNWLYFKEIIPPFSNITPYLPYLLYLPDLTNYNPLNPLNSLLTQFSKLQVALPILKTLGVKDRTTNSLVNTSFILDNPPYLYFKSIITEFFTKFINLFVSLS